MTAVAPTPAGPAPPAAKPPAAAPPAPPPKPPRTGVLHDRGVVWRETVHATEWTVRGQAKVTGEADAGRVTLDGATSIGGALTADALRSDGALDVGGLIEVAGALHSTGTLRTRAAVHAAEADLVGQAHVDGPLRVDRALSIRGLLVAPSAQAGSIDLDGSAEVEGALDADRVQARFRSASRVGSIRAHSVLLTVRPPNPIERVLGRHLPVAVARVEADTVELAGVDVRFVRAREVVLGRDAHVTEVEGSIVRRHPTARVGPESRSPPPHGLSR